MPVTYRHAGKAVNGDGPYEGEPLSTQQTVYLDGKVYVMRGNNVVRVNR